MARWPDLQMALSFSVPPCLRVGCFPFFFLEGEQSLQQEVLPVNQRPVRRPGAATVTQNSQRRKVMIDQRLSDVAALLTVAIGLCFVLVRDLMRQIEQSAGDDRCCRAVPVAVVDALVVEVVPRHSVFREFVMM